MPTGGGYAIAVYFLGFLWVGKLFI